MSTGASAPQLSSTTSPEPKSGSTFLQRAEAFYYESSLVVPIALLVLAFCFGGLLGFSIRTRSEINRMTEVIDQLRMELATPSATTSRPPK